MLPVPKVRSASVFPVDEMKFLYVTLLVVMYGITPWISLFGEVAERQARDREIVYGLGPSFDWSAARELPEAFSPTWIQNGGTVALAA